MIAQPMILGSSLLKSPRARLAYGRCCVVVAGPQPETVRDYTIEGEVDGQWRVLCNVTGNYQRRRVHTLPCPTPTPSPLPPPPAKPVVAAGSVSATNCDVSDPAQRWAVAPAAGHGAGVVSIRSGTGSAARSLCLSYDANTSA